MSLRVQQVLSWLGLAVSYEGKMISPVSSRAVVGTFGGSVLKRTLKVKDMTSVSSTAPIDAVQVKQPATHA